MFDAKRTHAHGTSATAALIGLRVHVSVIEEHSLGRVHPDMAGTVELGADCPISVVTYSS